MKMMAVSSRVDYDGLNLTLLSLFWEPPNIDLLSDLYDYNENVHDDLYIFLVHVDLDSTTRTDLTMWSIDLFLLI